MAENCPKCGGPVWDNRGNKKNPRSPDFKCKDKNCGHGTWMTPKPTGNGAASSSPRAPETTWSGLAMTYRKCWAIAGKVVGEDSPDRQAATATLFIQATRAGLSGEAPKPAPPPPPPPPPVQDVPQGMEEDWEQI